MNRSYRTKINLTINCFRNKPPAKTSGDREKTSPGEFKEANPLQLATATQSSSDTQKSQEDRSAGLGNHKRLNF